MADAAFKADFSQAVNLIDRLPRQVVDAIEYGMLQGAEKWVGIQRQTQMNGRPGLKAPTGVMRESWYVKNSGTRSDFKVTVVNGPQGWYAKLHQTGGRFTSRGKMFSIPIHPSAQGHSPKDFGGQLKLIARPGHPALLVREHLTKKTGKLTRDDIMFVLKRTITIPKRLYMPERWPDVVDMMRSRVTMLLKALKRKQSGPK